MGWTTKALQKVLGQIAPQYFSDANDDWEPVKGENGAINTQLLGSIAEYTWDASDPNPDPGASVRAFGVKHDAGVFTPYYWDGTSWEAI